jgi:hypothetical protein
MHQKNPRAPAFTKERTRFQRALEPARAKDDEEIRPLQRIDPYEKMSSVNEKPSGRDHDNRGSEQDRERFSQCRNRRIASSKRRVHQRGKIVDAMIPDGTTSHLRKLAPLFVIGGLCLFSAPLFHPNNTCADWLEKWGQLSALRSWIPIHQVATLGWALGAAALLLFAILGPRHTTGLSGGGAGFVGFLMMSLVTLIHATAVSTIATAYNAATSAAQRDSLRIIANAFVSYDVAVEGVAAVLISGGTILLAYSLHRMGAVSAILALVLAGDGSIWAVQYYRLLRFIHPSLGFPEWVPYSSLGLWLCAVSIVLTVPARSAARAIEPVATTA